MAEGPDRNQEYLARHTLGGAFRALAESAPAEAADGFQRSQEEISSDLRDTQVARRRMSYGEAARELESRGIGALSFEDAHQYAAQAAEVAIRRTEPAKRAMVEAVVTSAHGQTSEPVHVTAYGTGHTWIEGSAYAVAAAIPQVLGSPLARASVSAADWRTDPAPAYPPTPAGMAAQRSWQFRMPDTPAGREAARAEARAMYAEAGLEPPDTTQGAWRVSMMARPSA